MAIEERFDKVFEIPEICPDFLKPHLVELLNNIKAFIKKEQADLVREMVGIIEKDIEDGEDTILAIQNAVRRDLISKIKKTRNH